MSDIATTESIVKDETIETDETLTKYKPTLKHEFIAGTEHIAGTEPIPRRAFLSLVKRFFVIVIFGWFLYPVIRFLIPPAQVGIDPNILSFAVSEIPMGTSKKMKYRGKPIVVIHTEGGIHALSAVCTHLGCIVNWDSASGTLICPCHKATYDLQGNVLSGPAPKSLFTLEANLIKDKIVIKKA
ncbi:MAG: ubiquinol-cytochrome c reductase iron-sulfur subunit [bacterium]